MGATLKVRDIDRGFRELRRRVQSAVGGAHVSVGVIGAKANRLHPGSKKGLTVGDVATINEFGATIEMPNGTTVVIPERSFIRATFDEKADEIRKRTVLLGRAVLLGRITERESMELLGMYMVGLIQERIADGVPPPNAPSTIKRKKSSKPLIASSVLRGSISHEAEP